MRSYVITFVCLMCILIAAAGPQSGHAIASGNIYYVATTGNDGNSGIITNPWKTIQHALDTVKAGDTINVIGGTYTETKLNFKTSGSADGGYITLQRNGNDVVNVNLATTTGYTAGIDTDGHNYLKIVGFNFRFNTAGGLSTYGLLIDSSSYVIVQDCYFTGSRWSGIYVNYCDNITIDGCELNNCRTVWGGEENMSLVGTSNFEVKNCKVHDPGSAQALGIDMKIGCHDGSVHDNEIYNLTGYYNGGIYIDSRGDSYNIDIYNNIVHDILDLSGTGISIADENGDTDYNRIYNINIHNNIIYNCQAFAIQIYGRDNDTYSNIYITDNIAYNAGSALYRSCYDIRVPENHANNIVVRNNIGYAKVANMYPVYDPNNLLGSSKLYVDHNHWYNSGGNWNSGLGSVKGTDYIESDPQFANPPVDFTISDNTSGSGTSYIPSVVTSAASGITANAAILNGNLTNKGSASNVNVSFEYGLTTGYGSIITGIPAILTAPGTFSASLTGLMPNKTYHYRAKVVGDGIAYGSDQIFTTSNVITTNNSVVNYISTSPTIIDTLDDTTPYLPDIDVSNKIAPGLNTVSASDISPNRVILTGELIDMGSASMVVVSFEYGLTTNYGNTITGEPATLTNPGIFSADVTGLKSNTLYHYRAKAIGDYVTYSSDQIFITDNYQPAVSTDIESNIRTTEPRITLLGVVLKYNSEISGMGEPTFAEITFWINNTIPELEIEPVLIVKIDGEQSEVITNFYMENPESESIICNYIYFPQEDWKPGIYDFYLELRGPEGTISKSEVQSFTVKPMSTVISLSMLLIIFSVAIVLSIIIAYVLYIRKRRLYNI